MPLEQKEIIEIDSLSLENQRENEFKRDGFWKIKEINKERRINLYHLVIHLLAFTIIIPFIFFILLGIDIPEVYSTLVSVVVGFYFARSLFKS